MHASLEGMLKKRSGRVLMLSGIPARPCKITHRLPPVGQTPDGGVYSRLAVVDTNEAPSQQSGGL